MKPIRIPYAKGVVEKDFSPHNVVAVLESKAHHFKPTLSQQEIVKKALDSPIASKSLEDQVKGKSNMVIITSDHTRPVPSSITLPILLRRIRRINPTIDIKILIATGYHRGTTKEEMLEKFGKEIVEKETVINHISKDDDSLGYVGVLPSGGDLWLNKVALETELLIAEGFIEPHFFAGFSGGRKSVLPGVAGAKTVLANHCSEFIASDYARTGIIEKNPIHKDMVFAAEKAGLSFILNVVIDSEKNIIEAFAGHSEKAHEKGCEFVLALSSIEETPKSDIVITSNGGYPLDQNIYQAVKGMTAAEPCCNPEGIIIMVAACNDGHGGEDFYRSMAEASSPREVLDSVMKIPRGETKPDQWEYQILARILDRFTVIMVTDQCDPQMIRDMHMEHAYTLDEALEKALAIKGSNAEMTIIPDGVSVIIK